MQTDPKMFLRRKTIEGVSDEDLVANVKNGQQASLAALWDRYAHLLFAVSMKYLKDTEQAKDLVTTFFGDLLELLAKHDVKAFRPWVHTVVRNRCLMHLRKYRPDARLDDHPEPFEEDDDEAMLHEATLQRLGSAIAELNEAQSTCIRLFYLERQSYQQTAERTGFSIEHVRSHLQNGRRNLRLLLKRAPRIGADRHAEQNDR